MQATTEKPSQSYQPYSRIHFLVSLPAMKLFFRVLFWVLGPIRTFGAKRVPREGGVLVLSNHLADVDPPVVQVACPRALRFMAKSELFDWPVVSFMLRWTKSFPVKRGVPDRNALKQAAELLKRGEAVCIFPEGQLSEGGELLPIKPGVALIIRMAGVPVICCALRNTNRIMPYGSLIPRPAFRSVPVRWGEPRTFDPHASSEEMLSWIESELKRLSSAA